MAERTNHQADTRDRFVQSGLVPVAVAGADFARLIEANQKVVADLVRTARIELQ